MVDVNIETLSLQIESNAGSSVSGLDALAASLSKLREATKGGLGLKAIANNMAAINNAANGITSTGATNIEMLANSLSKLGVVGNMKLSSSFANQIEAINTALAGLDVSNMGKIQDLANGLQPLTTLGNSKLSSFINQMKKLPEVSSALDSMDISKFTTNIQRLSDSLGPLANNINTVSSGFSKLPANVDKANAAMTRTVTVNATATRSYVDLWAKMRTVLVGLKGIGGQIASWINESNQFVEAQNLFNVSLGSYAAEAQEYAEQVSEVMGIDPAEWMKNQGVFDTIVKGFGVVEDKAYTMSQGLTQLSYDLSSFANISTKDAFQKVSSGISGELEPLRRLGYDLSVARLQQEALNLGITKSVSAMTQAEKSQLRYYTMMKQVSWSHGDMARTLEAPANQLRVFKAQLTMTARTLGDVFIPILNKVISPLIALLKVLRMVVNVIAGLLGIKKQADDTSESVGSSAASMGDLSDSTDDTTSGLKAATKQAKELKATILGFDELNLMNDNDDRSNNGSGSGTDALSGLGEIDIPIESYDFLGDAVSTKVDEIVDKMKEWLGVTDDINSWSDFFNTRLGKILATVGAIGAAFAGWKIAKGISGLIGNMQGAGALLGTLGQFGMLSAMVVDATWLIDFVKDLAENGPSFYNVGGIISEFAGILGNTLILLGNLKVGGALKVVQGVGEITTAIKHMIDTGINTKDVAQVVKGIGSLAMGIGAITGNTGVLGAGLIISGIATVIPQLKNVWTAIKTGDWSGVDKVALISGAVEALIGVAMVLSKLKAAKATIDTASGSAPVVQQMSTTTSTLSQTIGGSLSPSLKSLVGNLGLGIAIIGEVAAAAIIIVGAIAVLGFELQAVANAWAPVMDSGETVVTALVAGALIMGAVGGVAYALGTTGATTAVNIGIGTAILAELGIATGLFIAEIWAIGWGLSEVANAWQPVLDNADTVKTGIATGTALLVAIGVVTASLGAATVASAGTIPIAIGIGTAVLVELGGAFVLFTESLVSVADELNYNLAPSLSNLNSQLPSLNISMHNFTVFMGQFAGYVVSYSTNTTISGIAATVDTIIGWFTADPFKKLSNDVNKIYTQTQDLNKNLDLAVPELRYAKSMLIDYKKFLTDIQALTSTKIEISNDLYVDMKDAGTNLVTGFTSGISSKSGNMSSTMRTAMNGVSSAINVGGKNANTAMVNITGTVRNSASNGLNSNYFYGIGTNISYGMANGINAGAPAVYNTAITLANSVANIVRSALDIHSPSRVFAKLGEYTVEGFNEGIEAESNSTQATMAEWVESFKDVVEKAGAMDLNATFTPNVQAVQQQSVDVTDNMVATLDYDSISKGVRDGMSVSSDRQNELLREQNNLLRDLLDKDTTVEITANDVRKAQNRQLRREGVAIG